MGKTGLQQALQILFFVNKGAGNKFFLNSPLLYYIMILIK